MEVDYLLLHVSSSHHHFLTCYSTQNATSNSTLVMVLEWVGYCHNSCWLANLALRDGAMKLTNPTCTLPPQCLTQCQHCWLKLIVPNSHHESQLSQVLLPSAANNTSLPLYTMHCVMIGCVCETVTRHRIHVS